VNVERTRNPRGQGARLREDILTAARALAEEGGERAVTLRAIARTVGITPTSIYPHFSNVKAIISALIDDAFDELTVTLSDAINTETDPARRLRTGCAAYVEFATQLPRTYETAFGQEHDNTIPRTSATRAFMVLVTLIQDCIEAGVSTSHDAFADATVTWVALHGYATMRTSRPAFPWPDHQATLDRIANSLAQLNKPQTAPTCRTPDRGIQDAG
jgi:AcrR family transcriptional regulator